jgi:phosphohistidine phosphatase
MIVYLLRHGKAEDGGPGMPDRDRQLTPEGVESMKEELPGIKKNAPSLDLVLTSPYPRAAQTARIAAQAYGIEDRVEETDALAAMDAEPDILKRIGKLPADSAVMCVGHSPLLGDLAAFLSGARDAYALKKGGLAKISFKGKPAERKGTFEWILKPRELKQG